MSPTVSVLLRVGNLSEIYCSSKCLSTYSKYPQLNDSHDSQSPRATGHAGGRNNSGRPALLSLVRWEPRCRSTPRTWLQDHWHKAWLLSPHQGCGVTVLGSGLIPPHALYLHQSFMAKTPCLSVISLMPFSITKPQLHSSVITKGSRTWFSGGLALVPPFPSWENPRALLSSPNSRFFTCLTGIKMTPTST